MKARELRTGNWVRNKITKYEFKVIIIDVTETTTQTRSEPIPLTEQWLIDFGFELSIDKDSGCGYAVLGEFNLWIDNGKIIYWKVKGSVECLYVHKLQNLFYELEGTELIKK